MKSNSTLDIFVAIEFLAARIARLECETEGLKLIANTCCDVIGRKRLYMPKDFLDCSLDI